MQFDQDLAKSWHVENLKIFDFLWFKKMFFTKTFKTLSNSYGFEEVRFEFDSSVWELSKTVWLLINICHRYDTLKIVAEYDKL